MNIELQSLLNLAEVVMFILFLFKYSADVHLSARSHFTLQYNRCPCPVESRVSESKCISTFRYEAVAVVRKIRLLSPHNGQRIEPKSAGHW